MSAVSRRDYKGLAFLSGGFRPFFLFGALYAGLSILLWLPQFQGELDLASAFSPLDWHVHELFFGFLPAIVTGFLFTAVPNWTGRLPVRGMPLLLLFIVWMLGRITVSFSAGIDWLYVLFIDVSFTALVAAVIANEIIAGKNWRNLKVLMPLSVIVLANIGFHLEVHFDGTSDYSRRAGASAIILLIMIIGGRVVPSFTRNWLARHNPGRLPAPSSRYDIATIVISLLALVVWIVVPFGLVTGWFMLIAAVLQFVRLARWAGDRTFGDFLVSIMHIAYLFVPVGFGLIAASVFWPDDVAQLAGIHALGVGAIGSMTLAIMARASLGHTGRALKATTPVKLMFAAVIMSAVARILAGLQIGPYDTLIHIAAFGWSAAFIGFGIVFAPALLLAQRHAS